MQVIKAYLFIIREIYATYTGRIIGIVYRADDVEDKLVMAPFEKSFTKTLIKSWTHHKRIFVRDVSNIFSKNQAVSVSSPLLFFDLDQIISLLFSLQQMLCKFQES